MVRRYNTNSYYEIIMKERIILLSSFVVMFCITSCVSAENCKTHKTENEIYKGIINTIKNITINKEVAKFNPYVLHLSNDIINLFNSRIQRSRNMRMASHTIQAITAVAAASITGISSSEEAGLASTFSKNNSVRP